MEERTPTRRGVMVPAVLLLALLTGLLGEVAFRVYQKAFWQVPLTAWIPNRPERQFVLSPFLAFGPRVDWRIPGRGDLRHAYFNHQGFRAPEADSDSLYAYTQAGYRTSRAGVGPLPPERERFTQDFAADPACDWER